MQGLPFSLDVIRFLADGRTDLLTAIFQFFTFLGDTEGYICVIALIYVAFDKRLAFRLAVLTIVSMSLNHLLKMVIRNPRPFVRQGTYLEKWAVSPEKAADLATEYSTPSGHAMAGGSFYGYLCACVRNKYVRVLAVLAMLLTGLSRPYLGVHYLEDILIGWPIGLAIAFVPIGYGDRISRVWGAFSHVQQVFIVIALSIAVWLVTRTMHHWKIEGQPTAYVGYMGFLLGLVVAYPLEIKNVNFDPRSAGIICKALRYVLAVGMVMGTMIVLDAVFERIAGDFSLLGYLLRYIRYAAVGVVAMYVAPLLFVKLKLAESTARP